MMSIEIMSTTDEKRSPFWFLTGNTRILVICRILWSFSTSIIYPYFSLYIIALGGTPAEVGLVNSIGIIAGMFLYPVGGYIADKMGRVKLVGYATVAYGLSHLFFVFASTWEHVAIGQFLTHLFLFYTPALNALQADSLPPGVRGKGFATISAIPNSVRIIAPYIGGYLIAFFGGTDEALIEVVRGSWGFAFLISLLVSFLRLRYLKETISEDVVKDKIGLKDIPRTMLESYKSIIDSVKWMDQSLWGIVIVEIVASLFVAMTSPYWVVYATNVVGISKGDWGSALLISGALGILLAFPIGSLVDHFGPRKMILTASLIAPAVIHLFIYANGYWSIVGILCFMTIINGLLMPSFSTIIANMIPRNRRGKLYSLLGERGVMISYGNFWGGGFLLFPAAALGSAIGGYIYEMNNAYLWYILPVAMILNFVLTFFYIKEPENAQN